MFTGLVQTVGTLRALLTRDANVRLVVEAADWGYEALAGDSIAVNGCCLTAVRSRAEAGGCFEFDAVPETLARTSLGILVPGSNVNLGHAVTASTLMGGHVVQGHIDAVGVVERVETGEGWRVRVGLPREAMMCVVPKGSVTVEGVSLTVAAVDAEEDWFEVALIPTTLGKTTLSGLRVGQRCNVETDIMARTIVHWLKVYGR